MRLERWVLLGGCALAFGAAFANTGVFLRTGTSVSHLTGDISRLSIDLARSTPEILTDVGQVLAATISFFGGAFLAGVLIHHPSLDFARPYGRAITGIGGLFLMAYFMLPRHPILAIALSAFGCGLQNSLATRYRGIVLRTTHLTGLITDFGITLGMSARGFDIPRWKIAVPALLTASFFVGGAAACVVNFTTGFDVVLIAGLAYVAAGVLWTTFKPRSPNP